MQFVRNIFKAVTELRTFAIYTLLQQEKILLEWRGASANLEITHIAVQIERVLLYYLFVGKYGCNFPDFS